MSQTDPNRYAQLSTEQLEDTLKQPGLPATEQQFVQEELTKRYMADLLKGTKAAPPRPEVIPATQAPVRGPRGRGNVWGVPLIIIVAVVLVFILLRNIQLPSSPERTSPPTSSSSETSSPPPTSSSTRSSPPTSAVQPTQVTPSGTFPGFSGKAGLDWWTPLIHYTGIAQFSGQTGEITVKFFSPADGADVFVLQDLKLQYSDGVWEYVGSNPRDASTGQLASYSPDTFIVSPTSTGEWTIGETCDLLQAVCASVTITPLR